MLEIANTRDAQGQSLFAGYHTNSQAFRKKVDGALNILVIEEHTPFKYLSQ